MKIRSNTRLNIFIMIFSIIFPLLVTGCSGVPGKLLVIQANFHNSQGRYNDAIAAYLKALEYEEAAPYAEYGLGSVYYSLGEEKASLERFSESLRLLDTFPENINRELRYRIHYNTGIVLFSGGDFGGAAVSFREALRADGGKIEAKRNLELSLKAKNRESTSNRENSGDTEKQNESKAVLMEYMRQKEINQWKSRTWPEEEDITGPDY
jgi:Ca-activated chloride channel family protein